MTVSTILVPLLGALLFASILPAQSPDRAAAAPKPAADVEALLAKLAATRGVAKAGKDTTIVLEGDYVVTFEKVGEVAKGPLREIFRGSDHVRSTSSVGEHGAMEKGITGELAWETDPMMGAKVLRGVHAAASRRWFALLRGDDPRTLYRAIEKVGVETIDGRELVRLRMTPAEGKPDTWYVAADGTLVRVDTALAAPESADAAFGMDDLMDARVTFADWCEQDGARLPKQRVLVLGPATVTSTFRRVAVGASLDAAAFTPPEAVTKLAAKPVTAAPATGADGKPAYQIVERTAQPMASIRVKVAATEISKQLGVLLPEIGQQLAAAGVRPAGAPFTWYHGNDGKEVDLEAGIPVQAAFTATGRVKSGSLPGGRCLMCWHVGPYDKLPRAHDGLDAALAAQQLKRRAGTFEIYWTDPGMVPDPTKWRTQLFAPIE